LCPSCRRPWASHTCPTRRTNKTNRRIRTFHAAAAGTTWHTCRHTRYLGNRLRMESSQRAHASAAAVGAAGGRRNRGVSHPAPVPRMSATLSEPPNASCGMSASAKGVTLESSKRYHTASSLPTPAEAHAQPHVSPSHANHRQRHTRQTSKQKCRQHRHHQHPQQQSKHAPVFKHASMATSSWRRRMRE
jgi:hypothetical protein